MALDHRRLIRPGKKKSGRTFWVPQVYFTKSCQQIWVRINQPFHHLSDVIFKNITSEIKRYYEALFLSYRQRTECSISQFCNTNCTHSIFKTIETRVGFLIAKPLKNFQSHLHGQPVLTFAVRVFEWTLIELRSYIIKNLLCLFFIQWFNRCVIFKSILAIWCKKIA